MGILDNIKHELFDDDGSAKPAAKPVAKSAIPAQPAAHPYTPVTFTADPPAVPSAPSYTGVTMPQAAAPTAEAMDMVKKSVYIDFPTHKSQYLMFMKMWEATGKSPDPHLALNALQAVSETPPTPTSILTDISGHIALLETVCQNAANEFANAAQQKLGGADAQIKALDDADAAAAAEIARHQQETINRSQQRLALQQARATDESAIANGKQNVELAEAAVHQELLTMQTLFTNLN